MNPHRRSASGVALPLAPRGEETPPARAGFLLEEFEYVPASPTDALVRLVGRWPQDAEAPGTAPGLLVEGFDGARRLAPLPDPRGWRFRADPAGWRWRAAFVVPLDVVRDPDARFAIHAGALVVSLPSPDARTLHEPTLGETVLSRRIRPYSLVAAGLIVAAFSPISLLASSDSHADRPAVSPDPAVVVSPDCPPSGLLPDGQACLLPESADSQIPGASPPGTPVQTPGPPVTGTTPPASTTPVPAPGTTTPPGGPDTGKVPQDSTGKPTVLTPTGPRTKPRPHRRPPLEIGGKRVDTARPERQRRRRAPRPVVVAPPTTSSTTSAAVPGLSLSLPGPAVAVPNVFIEKFPVPPFLLPIYQAAGVQYGIPWQILAAINEIETDYGRNLNVSSAGALGWMQFMPQTWASYGVDANADGREDPYNPADAIFAAARYLRAAGGNKDLHRAIFAYNHAEWYVQSVMLRAKLLNALPADLVSSLTGLTQAHFPVTGLASYPGQVKRPGQPKGGHASYPVEGTPGEQGIDITAREGAPVIAVNDGVVKAVGRSKELGLHIVLEDVYGNRFTYSHLGRVAASYPAPKESALAGPTDNESDGPATDPVPTLAATGGKPGGKVAVGAKHVAPLTRDISRLAPTSGPTPLTRDVSGLAPAPRRVAIRRVAARTPSAPRLTVSLDKLRVTPRAKPVAAPAAPPVKERLFAHPARTRSFAAGGERQLHRFAALPSDVNFKSYFSVSFPLKPSEVVLKPLKPGARVIAGTVLGHVGRATPTDEPKLHFQIRPAGKGSPLIDPRPILDGWRLLNSTAIYRAAGHNPFFGPHSKNPTIGQILLMSKEELGRRVLSDPRIHIYPGGRTDIMAGAIDRRVMALLAFLAASGLDPTVSSLKTGHGFFTASGNVSEHSSGDAVDIAAINGVSILGHQGAGSITETAIRRLLTLNGSALEPHQVISLMTFKGAANTMSLPDHANHIHVGFQPVGGGTTPGGRAFNAVLKPGQWNKLIAHLGELGNPVVPTTPSRYSIRTMTRSSSHTGE